MQTKIFYTVAVLLACIVLTPDHIRAEEKQQTALETITVTAQKQEENIQDVPMGITALTAQDIEDRKIESIEDLTNFVPNYMVFCEGGPGMYTPTMREFMRPLKPLRSLPDFL